MMMRHLDRLDELNSAVVLVVLSNSCVLINLRDVHPSKRCQQLMITRQSLVPEDQADNVGSVSEFCLGCPPERHEETAVEEERLKQCGGNLLLLSVVSMVVGENDSSLPLQVLILLGPAKRLVNLRGRDQCGEDR